jgi:putative cell wall-binding protein
MPIPRSRRGLAIGLAVTTAAIAITTVTLNGANASQPGAANSPLTTYDGSAIHFVGGASISAHSTSTDGAWAPDGSRFVYIGNTAAAGQGAVLSVRANDTDGDASSAGGSAIAFVDGPESGARRHPTWAAQGTALLYSEQVTAGGPWSIGISAPAEEFGDSTLTPDDGTDYTWPDGGGGLTAVAQRQTDDGSGNPTGAASVVAIDLSTGDVTPVIDDASQPSISPDGTHVAFVRSDGTHKQIWTSDLTGAGLVAITSDATDHGKPTWSPDGTTIAFTSGTGIATASASGSDAATPTPVSNLAFGEPTYQPLNKDHVVQLSGANRFATAIAISQSHWATSGATGDNRQPAQSVTLSRSDTFADAVSGSALAAAKQGPLLLTPPTSLDAGTKAEIKRVLPTGSTVYLLGGTGAISTAVQNAITTMGYTTKRLSGANRYETSVAIAGAISPNPQLFLLATGQNFPDALSAGALAGSFDAFPGFPAVVILSNDKTMPVATENYLDSFVDSTDTLNAFLFAIGGQADLALQSAGWSLYGVEAGANRYGTAQAVATDFYAGEQTVGVTTGLNWPDALAGGALLGTLSGPLLLSNGAKTIIGNTQSVLSDNSASISTAFIFGGTLPSSNNGQIGAAISGPDGFDTSLPSTMRSMQRSAAGAGSKAGRSGLAPKLPANATKAKQNG